MEKISYQIRKEAERQEVHEQGNVAALTKNKSQSKAKLFNQKAHRKDRPLKIDLDKYLESSSTVTAYAKSDPYEKYFNFRFFPNLSKLKKLKAPKFSSMNLSSE